jgi:predicted MFS family arabinose efflux permease
MQTKRNFFITAAPLLLVLFIDGMGLSLVVPLLNSLMFDPHSSFFSGVSLSPAMHNFIYGAIISLYMLCWFFGAAWLGDLSDHVGRKKSLTICLLGAGFSYLISAVAVIFHSLTLLLIGRMIAGLTSGSQPIAQAAIVDLSDDQDKARNIGFILMSASLGFMLGPLLGGLLSDNRIVSWFDFSIPFYFAALISFINLILLGWLFHENFVVIATNKISLRFSHAFDIFISAFKHEKIKKLSVVFFIYIFGWSSFYSFISLFLIKEYAFTPTQVSLFMAVMGVGFCIGTGVMVQYLVRRFSLASVFNSTLLLGAFFALLIATIHHAWVSWVFVAPLVCCVAIAYSVIVTIFSNQVDASKQGWVMGITGSIMALVWAVNGVIVGIIAAVNPTLPILISAVTLALVALCYYFLHRSKADR